MPRFPETPTFIDDTLSQAKPKRPLTTDQAKAKKDKNRRLALIRRAMLKVCE